jgi:hypothetical protein
MLSLVLEFNKFLFVLGKINTYVVGYDHKERHFWVKEGGEVPQEP